MPFRLTERQRNLREEVREFAESEIRPRAIELDRNEEYPGEILAELGDRGYTGITLPEEYGGRGEGLVELVVLTEELAAAMMTVASALALNLGVATVIERFGTDAQKDEYLPEMARYDRVGALGLSEANAGANKLEMETTAERSEAQSASERSSAKRSSADRSSGQSPREDGVAAEKSGDEWVIDGHKQWVTNFQHADFVLTYARTGPDADAPHNISAFLVPTEEFEVEEVWETLGARNVKSPRVRLSNVRVPDENRVGEVGEAYVQRAELHTGVNVPARGVGIARAALEDATAYTAEREQFDQPIGDFQGVRWTIGEMAQRADAARLLTLRAADRADRGEDVSREFAMAKVHATEAAVENSNDAMQLLGGKGYTTEHHVERHLRDARLLTIAGGPNEVHRNSLADAVYSKTE